MSNQLLRATLQALTAEAFTTIENSSKEGFQNAIAYFDMQRDQVITSCKTFQSALEAVSNDERIASLFGSGEANRITLQFVYNAYKDLKKLQNKDTAFEDQFSHLCSEMDVDYWTYRAVANIQNFECDALPVELEDGISFRLRSLEEISHLLHWGSYEIQQLTDDWSIGAHGSNILLIETQVKKSPDNFLLSNDGSEHLRMARILLAMRLVKQGDIRIGRLFTARPSTFNVGLGGLASFGVSYWHPGPTYKLQTSDISTIKKIYQDLSTLEATSPKSNRNLLLAIRSFSSIYDRFTHQGDDRIVDSITALEALWKLDQELSFRLSFRTSSLLAQSDDERLEIFDLLTNYYKIRSKIVHGGELSTNQEQAIHTDERLQDIVRRCLRGFLHLAIHPNEWKLSRIESEADKIFLHSEMRTELQQAMQIR
ncbi:MAG TPA: HEPN domain-containing protein [Pseudobdellovibrionaceae bacterium]|nr:HEPN domain-containing protein [Pseudobdellovibrionaceae bacterium]